MPTSDTDVLALALHDCIACHGLLDDPHGYFPVEKRGMVCQCQTDLQLNMMGCYRQNCNSRCDMLLSTNVLAVGWSKKTGIGVSKLKDRI